MVDQQELNKRIQQIKEILDLQNDDIHISLIPEESCRIKPFCDYKATYQKDNNAIFIHPDSLKNDTLSDLTGNIAHELYHAYKYKTKPKLFDTEITQGYHLVGINYIKQPLEIQAYAFQLAIMMMYEEAYIKYEKEGVDEKTTNKINELADKYYNKYKNKFFDVVFKNK